MTAMTSAPSRSMLDSLTALRFYAALMVVVYHLTMAPGDLAFLEPVTGFGYTGVSFFFILSGFVLTWSQKPSQSKREFYWRRFARVWPLHVVTMMFAIGTAWLTLGTTNWKALPFTLTLTQALVPRGDYQYAFNGASWSLSAEAFFYALFPFLFWIVSGRRKLRYVTLFVFAAMALVGLGVTAIMPPGPQDHLLYAMPLYRVGEFIVGICLAVAFQRGWRPRITLGQTLLGAGLLYLALVLVAARFTVGAHDFPRFAAALWMMPGYMAVIAAAASHDIAGRTGKLQAPVLVTLGRWSFALYLIHQIMINLVGHFTAGLGVPAGAVAVAVLIASVGLSGVLHLFVEVPAERALRSRAWKREPEPSQP